MTPRASEALSSGIPVVHIRGRTEACAEHSICVTSFVTLFHSSLFHVGMSSFAGAHLPEHNAAAVLEHWHHPVADPWLDS